MRGITVLLSCFLACSFAEKLTSYGKAIVESNEDFSKAWYEFLVLQPGNFFISPISTEIAFSMLSMGAKGATKSQLLAALKLPENDTVSTGFQNLLHLVQGSRTGVTLDLANKVYIDSNFKVRDTYISCMKEFFLADVESARLRSKSEESKDLINNWVKQKTHGKIQEIMSSGMPHANTAMVLVSAVYFKGSWYQRFKPELTQKKNFYLDSGSVVKVDMMMHTGLYEYDFLSDFGTFILKLPYEGKSMSMVIITPRRKGLSSVESALPKIDLKSLGNTNSPERITVSIPKFKVETTLDLIESFMQMGVRDAFDENADFSDLGDGPLQVDYALQKTFIEVNEEGSEAAAATGIGITIRSGLSLEVNRPFLFMIRHEPSGAILFLGRYTGPDEK